MSHRACDMEILTPQDWRNHTRLTKHRKFDIDWAAAIEREYGEVVEEAEAAALEAVHVAGNENVAEVLLVESLAPKVVVVVGDGGAGGGDAGGGSAGGGGGKRPRLAPPPRRDGAAVVTEI